MANERRTLIMSEINAKRIYSISKEFIECTIEITNSISDGTSEKNAEKKAAFEKRTKKAIADFEELCKDISSEGISAVDMYAKGMIDLFEKGGKRKEDIVKALGYQESLKIFRKARESIPDLYPILCQINDNLPVDNYYELTLTPDAYLYGSIISKDDSGTVGKLPQNNEVIKAMIELFQFVKDDSRLGEWMLAVLVYDPKQMDSYFPQDIIGERKALKEWGYNKICSDSKIKRAVMDYLLKNHQIDTIFKGFRASSALNEDKQHLLENVNKLENELSSQKEEFTKIIEAKDNIILSLKQNLQEFNLCKEELMIKSERLDAQIGINERITIENERLLKEMEEDYYKMQDELTAAIKDVEKFKNELIALQSDYSLKCNELERMKLSASQKEDTAKFKMLQDFVNGVNDQFFYLTMFYLELKETGKLTSDSIELFSDTLKNIDYVFESIGIQKIGIIEQETKYDSSIHISTDGAISNGEKVIVKGYGWKINNEVLIKAPVEKGE